MQCVQFKPWLYLSHSGVSAGTGNLKKKNLTACVLWICTFSMLDILLMEMTEVLMRARDLCLLCSVDVQVMSD
uniref:Uncharacterized protein n=1 Tax=Anguilla anguilla TaxID=7936 RepID=A0A0E9WDK5_ANGAN